MTPKSLNGIGENVKDDAVIYYDGSNIIARGIGKAICEKFISEGYFVFINYKNSVVLMQVHVLTKDL